MIRRIGSGKPLALRQRSRRSGRGERTLLFAAVHQSIMARGRDLPAPIRADRQVMSEGYSAQCNTLLLFSDGCAGQARA